LPDIITLDNAKYNDKIRAEKDFNKDRDNSNDGTTFTEVSEAKDEIGDDQQPVPEIEDVGECLIVSV
jgi:hypothetical protein